MQFRKMRRHKQELSRDECIDILTNEPRGVLALLGDYDYPYALPMSHVYVDGKIYFHGANIQKCKKKEKIRTLTDNAEKIDKLTHLGDKFFPTHEDTVNEISRLLDRTEVFEITIEHMSGKIVQEK